MTYCRAHSREQFIHTEWLGDVVVCAKIEGLYLPGFVATAG
jgi:hypothetical protein